MNEWTEFFSGNKSMLTLALEKKIGKKRNNIIGINFTELIL